MRLVGFIEIRLWRAEDPLVSTCRLGNPPSSLVLLEMAGHYQGGAVLTEATTSQYHSVPGLLPEGAHSLGEPTYN